MADPTRADTPRRSLLDAHHRGQGAKMTPFGGWEMPLQYTGVLAEHEACRTRAAAFDVSHLGGIRITGAGAFDGLQHLLSNDLRRIHPGRAQYTHLLDNSDGHVVDDIIVWWLDGDDFLVVPNAVNTEPTLNAIAEDVRDADFADVTATRAFVALQGPTAREVLAAVLPDAADVGRFEVAVIAYGGVEVIVGGTGYTGEDGVELFLPAPVAGDVWGELVTSGATPAGLGARDLLRLEMGYPLHGHELGPGVTPLQAGLEWVVGWDKDAFRGREALRAERERGLRRRLRGLRSFDRRIPRDGCSVLDGDQVVGVVTSGNFSPTLGRGIALAFLDPAIGLESRLEVEIRGKKVPVEIADPPFVTR